jgi:site-specific recombinase XerD
MASLVKHKSGIYYIEYYNRGKRIWRTLSTRDRNIAYQRFLEYEQKGLPQKSNPLPPIPEQKAVLTIAQAIKEYLPYAKANFSEHTCKTYESTLNMFSKWVKPETLITEITTRDMERFKSNKFSGKISPHTVNHDLRCIKAFFNVLIAWELLEKNPCRGIKPLRTDDTIRPYLSREELQTVLEHTKGTQLHDIILFAVLTGLRLGEIVNLNWDDILLEKRKIIIRSNGNFRTKSGKMRTIPISSKLLDLLNSRSNKNGLLFGQMRTEFVSKQFKKAIRDCGLSDKLHFHSLRHTFGSYLVESGVSLFHVQQLLGHSSPWVTQIYAHLGTNELMGSVEKLGIGE